MFFSGGKHKERKQDTETEMVFCFQNCLDPLREKGIYYQKPSDSSKELDIVF